MSGPRRGQPSWNGNDGGASFTLLEQKSCGPPAKPHYYFVASSNSSGIWVGWVTTTAKSCNFSHMIGLSRSPFDLRALSEKHSSLGNCCVS
eukprot:6314150-Amphidinium_carterae.2